MSSMALSDAARQPALNLVVLLHDVRSITAAGCQSKTLHVCHLNLVCNKNFASMRAHMSSMSVLPAQ